VNRNYPFGWAYDFGKNDHGIIVAINETSHWQEIHQLGVSTDGISHGNVPKLNALSLVQIDTRVSVTSAEMSSGFSPLQNHKNIDPFPAPVIDIIE
jgi:hypothetical protein